MVNFKNLEELNLSHNNISDIKPLLLFKKLKKVDLSFNNINDIKPLKEIIQNNENIVHINLENNKINNVNILKEINFSRTIQINLDNNNILLKEIEDIKNLVIKTKSINNNLDLSTTKSTNKKLTFLFKKKINQRHNLRYRMFDLNEQSND